MGSELYELACSSLRNLHEGIQDAPPEVVARMHVFASELARSMQNMDVDLGLSSDRRAVVATLQLFTLNASMADDMGPQAQQMTLVFAASMIEALLRASGGTL